MNMTIRKAVCGVVALTLASANLAFAQGRGERDQRADRRDDRVQRQDRERRGERDRADNRRRGGDYARHDNGRRGPPEWANNRYDRPVPQYRRWNKGDRIPLEYRDRQYIVSDWRAHRLPPPPRGHYWIQSGGDYLLVAIATGVILEFLLGQ